MATRLGKHITLEVDPAGGTTWQSVGVVKDVSDLGSQVQEMAEVSLLGDRYKKYRPIDIDPGELKFSVEYDPEEATNIVLAAAMVATSAVAPAWRVTLADVGSGSGTAIESFAGYISNLGRPSAKGDHLIREVTIRISGSPGLTVA